MSIRWGELTTEAIAEAAGANAQVLLPLGCTEQHAHHLPVDTDTYQVERAGVEGARIAFDEHGVQVLVLPPLPYGPASEHYGMAGTISLTNELYVQLVKQIVWSVLDAGFRRVVTVRGCGGHWAVPGALWDLKADTRRAGLDVVLRVISVSDGWNEVQQEVFGAGDGGHAALMETALALGGRSELVRVEHMRAPELRQLEERYRAGGEVFLFDELTDTGALGDPGPATVEGGEQAWRLIVERFAARLRFFDEQDRALGRL